MRNTKLDNFHEPGSGTETNGIGAPKKQELNVSDAGSVTPPPPPPASCERKAFKGFKKKGMLKEAIKPEKVEKKSKRQEETEDEKGRKYKRLTAAFATTYNEANNSSDNDE